VVADGVVEVLADVELPAVPAVPAAPAPAAAAAPSVEEPPADVVDEAGSATATADVVAPAVRISSTFAPRRSARTR